MLHRAALRSLAVTLFLLLPIVAGRTAALAQYQMVPVAAVAPAESVPPAPAPFGLDTVPVDGGPVLAKWNAVAADIAAEDAILARCHSDSDLCPPAAQRFLAVIADGRAHQGRARFGVINRAVNLAIQPTSDLTQWGVPDRWSAPLVTFATGRGDCEDYAIAKYVALREAGVADDDLRLVIVRDVALGQDHAVVAARLEGKWIVLDNRRFTMVQDVEMTGVVPLFVLDHDGVRQFAPPSIADAHAAISIAPSSLRF